MSEYIPTPEARTAEALEEIAIHLSNISTALDDIVFLLRVDENEKRSPDE